MGLFKGNGVKKVTKLVTKGEERRIKLQEKVRRLKEDIELLYQAVQDDFNKAILNDGEPDKKLSKDLDKAREELKTAQFHLSQIDEVVKAELGKAKETIDKERKEFKADKSEEFRKIFDELNEMKLAYLNKIVEYSKTKQAYTSEYWDTFRNVEDLVGLRRHDPRDDFHIPFGQSYQTERHYNPMVYNDELREALGGKIHGLTERNKDKYKK
ncbi:hypothetical protein [Priestia endophytica]|uniref:hypothetical protein n=1 Tax=Priestia endophytica TaxID=135735 RepID=UPI002280518A|nr:hypothetical protein [Priestia endophytica]MCY8233693.1 hypothetical protein [Priestia endophytica]